MDHDRIVEIGARALYDPDNDGRWAVCPDHYASVYRDGMRAVLAAFEEAGLAVVPVEPTPEMRQLGGEFNCPTETLTSACEYAVDVYKAMVRVAQGKEPGYDAAAKADSQ